MKRAILLLITFSIVTAWWEVGHMMTSQVAKQVLLKENPGAYDWAEQLVFDLNKLTDGNSNSFVEAAVWADDIKETGMNYLNNWHFTDRPINKKGLLISLSDDIVQINSIDALRKAKSVLTNPKTINQKHTVFKAQMIRYILHVIGDMHQPLHNSNFFNATYKSGDLGGNYINVYRQTGEKVNLHAFWDAGAFLLQPSDDYLVRPLNDTAVTYMENLADSMISKYPKSYFGKIDMINPEVWTTEGYYLSQNNVYPGVEATNQIGDEYQQAAFDLIEKQVVLGGYRLAQYITDIYAQVRVSEQQAEEQQSFVELKFQELRK